MAGDDLDCLWWYPERCVVLFHLTISHDPQECPGRRPGEPPALVAPSDTRKTLERELGVTPHFVLWGASCMLWAQPEHLAFVVLEADDLDSVSKYARALIPPGWSFTAMPVWNLPAQLRLVHQVRLAPPMEFGPSLASARERLESVPTPLPVGAPGAPPAPNASAGNIGGNQPSPIQEPTSQEIDDPGTITRLLRELDAAPTAPSEWQVTTKADREAPDPSHTPTQILSPLAPESASNARIWLVSIAGPAKGKTFVVGAEGATIGRVPDIPVCIPDERLSREHARINFRDGGYWLADLGSTNGTTLNGVTLTAPQQLQSGDSIEIGASLLVATIEPTAG